MSVPLKYHHESCLTICTQYQFATLMEENITTMDLFFGNKITNTSEMFSSLSYGEAKFN